jgi:3-methylfumaryl-CoA hydratase
MSPHAGPPTDPMAPTLADAGFAPSATAVIAADRARALAATLDADPDVLAGGALPLLWHWVCFVPANPTAALGPDGHPRRRPEMAAFPQRMWGGSRVTEHVALRLDAPARRDSALVRAERKAGTSGDFWVLTVEHRIHQDGALCLVEEHDVVLRAPGPLAAAGPARADAPADEWVEERVPDAVLLFRYSALTFNSHRIHYDLPYATQVEGYPDLVVHGPLLATLLADLARRGSGRSVRAIRFRARAPVFANQRIWLTGHADGDGAALRVLRADHSVAVTLDAELGP